jgi:amidophosphoribosyltransferase
MGLVCDAFSEHSLRSLPGRCAVGHVRYSTAGDSHIRNAQPFAADYALGSIAVAHNGNLTNARELRERLESCGAIFQSNSDTEVLVHLVATSSKCTVEERIVDALSATRGAYSLVLLAGQKLYAVRDPMGFRPLVLGQIRKPDSDIPAWVVASESTSFDLIGASFVREVEPGEMLCIDESGCHSSFPLLPQSRSLCIFEYVYFARPDAVIDGLSVYSVRKALGARLAVECPASADIVVPVPDSGVAAATGFAQALNLPLEMGLIRSHYVGRTFIEPQQTIRHFGVRLKFNTIASAIQGRRVVIVDDSIVRGTTIRKIVAMVREAGATQVHVRVSSPPTAWPCYYGIDTPTRNELIAATHSIDQIQRHIEADSLGYLSNCGMLSSVRSLAQQAGIREEKQYCDACFSGRYPVAFDQSSPRKSLRVISSQ